jgi:ornithine decarboxylase
MTKFITSRQRTLDLYHDMADLGLNIIYSRKTNPLIWQILRDTDCDVACHSIAATRNVQQRDKIWYYPLATTADEYKRLYDAGIRQFVIDNTTDLDRLLDTLDGVDLLLRMQRKERTMHAGRHYVFGMAIDDVHNLIHDLKGDDRINRLGVHFHRKTQNIAEWNLTNELPPTINPVLDEIDLLNIGGGFPAPYKSVSDTNLDRIFDHVREFRAWLPDEVTLQAEPGRYIAAPSTKCEADVLDIRDNTIFIDWSIFNGCLDAVLVNYRLHVEGELEQGNGERYLIKGKTPDSQDVLRYEVWLEDVGDTITFENAGAYNFTTDFCELEKPEEVIVDTF